MKSQVFLLTFLLFSLLPQLICALQSDKSLEFDLHNFNGALRKGDHNAKLVHELKKHLMYFGYLHPTNMDSENFFDHHLEHAINKYQEFYSMNITGVVDINTLKSIRKPRCGVPDFFSPQTHFKSLFSFYQGNPRWAKRKLKYQMTDTVIAAHRPPIEQALRAWQSETHFMFFPLKCNVHNESDITISFEREDHGDGVPFRTIEMAHAFKPPRGMLHFNAEKRWASDGDKNAYDIFSVALHELGHVLGLEHSMVPDAIMFPELQRGQTKVLHQDDIHGIKALYGL